MKDKWLSLNNNLVRVNGKQHNPVAEQTSQSASKWNGERKRECHVAIMDAIVDSNMVYVNMNIFL